MTFGVICGFTHQIISLQCAIDNKAATLLNILSTSDGFIEYGLPNLIRGDAGMENVAIARLINHINGPSHFIIGRSVNNQRIERLWRDVYSNVIDYYHSIFTNLYENMEHNPYNTWILQYLFLDRINEDLSGFIHAWNAHSMSTVRGMSPNKQHLMSATTSYREERTVSDENVRTVIEELEEVYEGRKTSNSICPFINEIELINFTNLCPKIILADNLSTIDQKVINAYTVAEQIVHQR